MYLRTLILIVLLTVCSITGFCDHPDQDAVDLILSRLIINMGENEDLAEAALVAEKKYFYPGIYLDGAISYEVLQNTTLVDQALNGTIDTRISSLDLGDGITVSGLISQTYSSFIVSDEAEPSGYIDIFYDLIIQGYAVQALTFTAKIDQSSPQILGVAEVDGLKYEINVLKLLQ